MRKKAAMEMSVGTLVTIVLLMLVLGLGIFLIQNIFSGATSSVDSINSQVKGQIDNLFNTDNKDIVVSLGAKRSGKVKQGTEDFGFVVAFAPGDADALTGLSNCEYNINALTSGKYCANVLRRNGEAEVESWFITGLNKVKFSEIQSGVAYDLVRMQIPDETPTCIQRYTITVSCPRGNYESQTYFDIEILKKGFLGF